MRMKHVLIIGITRSIIVDMGICCDKSSDDPPCQDANMESSFCAQSDTQPLRLFPPSYPST